MMSAEDQDVFIVILKTAEELAAQSWALQGILDHHGVKDWRESLEEIQAGILPIVRSKLRPLSDAIVGVPPLGSQDTSLPQWRAEMQASIRSLLEYREKPEAD